MPTVEEVCIVGPAGYGECWGCPVRTCVLWEDPEAILSEASSRVVANSIERLQSNRTVVFGRGGAKLVAEWAEQEEQPATALISALLLTSDYGKRIRAEMAAEAIVQEAPEVHAEIVKMEDRYLREWMAAFTRREPSVDEVQMRDERIETYKANLAADIYNTDYEMVRSALRQIRGLDLRPSPAYRRKRDARSAGLRPSA